MDALSTQLTLQELAMLLHSKQLISVPTQFNGYHSPLVGKATPIYLQGQITLSTLQDWADQLGKQHYNI
jgi:hypothetical protein